MTSIVQLRKQQEAIGKQLRKREIQAAELRKKIDYRRREIAKFEEQLTQLLGKPGAAIKLTGSAKPRAPREEGPTQKEIIEDILVKAGKPLSLNDILDQLQERGYKWQSGEPRNALGVLMYTNQKTFKKVKPGYFGLR